MGWDQSSHTASRNYIGQNCDVDCCLWAFLLSLLVVYNYIQFITYFFLSSILYRTQFCTSVPSFHLIWLCANNLKKAEAANTTFNRNTKTSLLLKFISVLCFVLFCFFPYHIDLWSYFNHFVSLFRDHFPTLISALDFFPI